MFAIAKNFPQLMSAIDKAVRVFVPSLPLSLCVSPDFGNPIGDQVPQRPPSEFRMM